jgi:hypothetical protein
MLDILHRRRLQRTSVAYLDAPGVMHALRGSSATVHVAKATHTTTIVARQAASCE